MKNIIIVVLGLLYVGLIFYISLYLGIFLGIADLVDAFGKTPVYGKEVAWIPVRTLLWIGLSRVLAFLAFGEVNSQTRKSWRKL